VMKALRKVISLESSWLDMVTRGLSTAGRPEAKLFAHDEVREAAVRREQRHGPGFRRAHLSLQRRLQVIVSGQVQPAVNEIEREFGGEFTPGFLSVGGGAISRNA